VSNYHCFKCGNGSENCRCFIGRIEFQQIPKRPAPQYGQTDRLIDEEVLRRIVREEVRKALKEST